MDGRIVTVTESLMRNMFNLNSNYSSSTCNVKKNTVEMTMNNELIEVKAKFPMDIIQAKIDTLEEVDKSIEDAVQSQEEADGNNNDTESTGSSNKEKAKGSKIKKPLKNKKK